MDREPDAPSPCISVCAIEPSTGFCRGCFRTIQEIAGWTMMTKSERLAVLGRLPERRATGGVSRDR
jgi:predicted Fe-S protein YdhL (DUF1289 family)